MRLISSLPAILTVNATAIAPIFRHIQPSDRSSIQVTLGLFVMLTFLVLPRANAALNCQAFMPPAQELIWVDAEYAISGDTLIIQNQRARLIGLAAPKKERKEKFNSPGQPLAEAAQKHLNTLLANQNLKVGVLYDQTQVDSFNRQLVHVFFEDGTNLQQAMLDSGFAIYRPEYNNTRFAQCYIEAENRARQGGYQLWDFLKKNPDEHYPLVESSKIYAEDEGFRIVRGQVQQVDRSGNHIIMNLDTTGIRIPKRAWNKFDYGQLQKLNGQTIEVRGQVFHYKGAMYLVVEEPLAIDALVKDALKTRTN